MNTRKVTIRDIARHANVSVGTVDRVIHNRGKVSPDKKKKIEEAVEQLNFNPNLLARALALRNQFNICYLIPGSSSENDYWYLPKYGAEQAAESLKDFGFFLETFEYDQFDEISFTMQANRIIELNPDGVILAPLFRKESISFVKKLKTNNIPYVFIDAIIPGQGNISYIGPDVERSGFVAGKLLKSLLQPGDQVLILNIVKGMENSSTLTMIEKGFRNYFAENEKTPGRDIRTLVINSTDENVIFQELTKFYTINPNIKGVFVTTSKAYLVARVHEKYNLDLRMIGFDLIDGNINCLREGSIDWIISQNPIQQGALAVKTLFDLLVHKTAPNPVQHVPLDIFIRENLDFNLEFQNKNFNKNR
jgi:LacI family transcriptional regulator